MARKKFSPMTAFSNRSSNLPPVGQRLFTGKTSGLGARFLGGPAKPLKFRTPSKRSKLLLKRISRTGRKTQKGIKADIRKGKKLIKTGKKVIAFGKKAKGFIEKRVLKKRQGIPTQGFKTVPTNNQKFRTFIQKERAKTKIQMPTNQRAMKAANNAKPSRQQVATRTQKLAKAFDRAAAGRL